MDNLTKEALEKRADEFWNPNNRFKWQEIMRGIAQDIVNDKIEPFDAYYRFIKETKQCFPHCSDVLEYWDYFYNRFNSYLLIWILWVNGKTHSPETKPSSEGFEGQASGCEKAEKPRDEGS